MSNILLVLCVRVGEFFLTALVGPDMQLLGQFRYDQESPPALTLLGFEDVTENVVSNVDDVLSFSTQQVADDV